MSADDFEILIDIDGMFANFIARSLPVIKGIIHDLGRRQPSSELARINAIEHDDVKHYAMERVFDLSPDEIAAWHSRVKSPGYCAQIPPYPGAVEAVAELQSLGAVIPVTFPWPGSPYWIPEREVWLRDVLGIDPDHVIYTRQKHRIFGHVFIEDTTKYLVAWRKRHPRGTAIRMARPYNLDEPFTAGVTVRTFAEMLSEVRTARAEYEAR